MRSPCHSSERDHNSGEQDRVGRADEVQQRHQRQACQRSTQQVGAIELGDALGIAREHDAVGRRLRLLREIPEKPGDSVIMTIDFDLQQVAERAIGDRAGAPAFLDQHISLLAARSSLPDDLP